MLSVIDNSYTSILALPDLITNKPSYLVLYGLSNNAIESMGLSEDDIDIPSVEYYLGRGLTDSQNMLVYDADIDKFFKNRKRLIELKVANPLIDLKEHDWISVPIILNSKTVSLIDRFIRENRNDEFKFRGLENSLANYDMMVDRFNLSEIFYLKNPI